jgi:hypothetical protein
VPDVAGLAAGPVDQAPVENQAAADPGGHDHAEHIGSAASGAAPMLADRDADRVVVHVHRHARIPLLKSSAQREVPPTRDVHR